MLQRLLVLAVLLAGGVLPTLAALIIAPVVRLDNATVTGKSFGRISKFLGIPFARPPIGSLRYRLPQPIPPYTSNFYALSYGFSCPEQYTEVPVFTGLPKATIDYIYNNILHDALPGSEDCLTVNVIKPRNATPGDKLPVIVWIYGGGFEIGGTMYYDGSLIVARSIDMGLPVIYVSMNYRLSGFGFLAGREIKEAGVGNLGLHDQREALRWVQKYIPAFGGDPNKVTIWGESAGAISVSLHMLAYNGNHENLFRAGFMQSGSPIPVAGMTDAQKYYDAIVQDTGCSKKADTLDCLRDVPYKELKKAIDKLPGLFAYQSLSLAFFPRADGVFLTDNPQNLVLQGKVAPVPFITGDCDDEGTLFALSTLNITTSTQFRKYLKEVFLAPGVSDQDLDGILLHYPEDPVQGSPFGTLFLNTVTPQYKRIAAFMGDGVFQAPRRFFLNHRSDKQDTWAFLNKERKALPILGTAHATDLLDIYTLGPMTPYLIRFASTLDPNPTSSLQWPKYDLKTRKLLTFNEGGPETITVDDYRSEAMDFLTKVTMSHPL